MTSFIANLVSCTSKLVQRCSTSFPVAGLPSVQQAVGKNVPAASVAWTSVRFRFHADKVARGPALRRFGYEDKIFRSGLLPRAPWMDKPLPIPEYKPKNAWNEKRALFGQNDYIDILGPSDPYTNRATLHPTELLQHIPAWLRGFQGNEYQMLIRKRKHYLSHGLHVSKPTKWKYLNQRLVYLNRFLNRHTKSPMWKKA